MSTKPVRSNQQRLTALASCVAACSPLLTTPVVAATHNVTNCSDSNPGSLRAVVGAATTHSGDTVSMAGLTCSQITLATGITVAQNSLTITGPGQNKLSVVRDYGDPVKHRIFRHTGTGTLHLTDMTLAGGYVNDSNTPPHRGGCIYSAYAVKLNSVTVKSCRAAGASAAAGGGIFASGDLTISYSTISGNTVAFLDGITTHTARGGGAYSSGSLLSNEGAITDNLAVGGPLADGGGVYAIYGITLTSSTISANHAEGSGGGVKNKTNLAIRPPALTIINSTISGNDASGVTGGVYSNNPATIENSTFAANTAGSDGTGFFKGVGLALIADKHPVTVELESSLLANNIFGSNAYDLDFSADPAQYTVTISGADNLIRNYWGTGPANSLLGACPLLGPLRDNGGPTKTHALLSHSPGIDAGNNVTNLAFDQRGNPFVRSSGAGVDIGAYENQAEIIFNNGFDGCAALGR